MTDITLGAIETIVRDTVVGRTAMAPAELSGLLMEIDYRERIVASRGELDACLGRLVDLRLIGQLDPQRYVDGRSASGSHVHVAISQADYDAALSDYQSHFRTEREAKSANASPGPPTDRQLLVTLPITAGREPTTDDWQVAEALAVRMCQLLTDHGRETRVATLETDPGRIEFSVLGHATDDPKRLRAIVLPLFETVAPPGSSLAARQWESWATVPSPTGSEIDDTSEPSEDG